MHADRLTPWPIPELRCRLLEGEILHLITRTKRVSETHDIRERLFEDLACRTFLPVFGQDSIVSRRPIGHTLGIPVTHFPGAVTPDVVLCHSGKIHILELKSSRVDYNRFDDVFDGRMFKEYLQTVDSAGQVPWEVEQDLIKLRLFPRLSDSVGSCLFLMIDAYAGSGRSWTAVFRSPKEFHTTMRTEVVRRSAHEFVQATTIESLEWGGAKARLITCIVHPWSR